MKEAKRGSKLSPLFYLLWSSPLIAGCITVALLGHVTYYATNVLGLPSALVGTLILASKVFDGFTDLVAGFLIDKTNTRFGRARPFDFAYAFFAIFTIVLFAVPEASKTLMAVYFFTIYTLIFSIFQTLYTTANPIYLARAVEGNDSQISVTSISTLLGTISAMVVSIMIPQVVARIGTSKAEWSKMAVFICIPCILLSLVRFFTIKERDAEVDAQAKINLKEGIGLLFHNKYILVFTAALLFTNIAQSMTQAHTYYFQYIIGDISLQSLTTIGTVFGPLTLIIFPMLTKKLGIKKLVQAGFICGIAGRLIPLIGLRNIPLLILSSILCGISYMPIYTLAPNAAINCMDYGEWKFGKRGEGIYSCVIGFCSKMGSGLASWTIGLVAAMGGFNGTQEVQSASANNSIILLFTVIPAVFFVGATIIIHFYKLDEKLPEIQEDLAKRRLTNHEG